MSEATATPSANFKGLGGAGLILGLIGLVGWGAMAASQGGLETALQSYVFAWGLVASMVLGCFGLTLLHHTVRGSWGLSVLRIFEAGGGPSALFLTLLGFIPIAMNLGTVYKGWMFPKEGDLIMLFKTQPHALGGMMVPGYLTPGFFIGRTIFYFAVWILFAYLLQKWSRLEDQTKDIEYRHKRTNLAAPGIVVFVITLTLAATDWFMSIDAHWFSTMFGPWYMIGGALFAMSFGTAIVCANAKKSPYNEVVSPSLTRDLGNLMFTFCMLWIYFTLSQFLIIWSGNLPEFISYYVYREKGALPFVGMFNVLFGWFLPWAFLLAPPVKAKPERLIYVAGLLLAMRTIDVYYNFVPLFSRSYPVVTDLLAIVGLGGLWLAFVGFGMQKAAPLPEHDTRLQEALQHSHA